MATINLFCRKSRSKPYRFLILAACLFVSVHGLAQHWSPETKLKIFYGLAQGGRPPGDWKATQMEKSIDGKKILPINICIHNSIFQYYVTIEDMSVRYYWFLQGFVCRPKENFCDSLRLRMLSIPFLLPRKEWELKVIGLDSVIMDQTPTQRLNFINAILPFHIEVQGTLDNVEIILDQIAFVSPIFRDMDDYMDLLASVIHFYAFEGKPYIISIVYHELNGHYKWFIYGENYHYKKKFPWIEQPPTFEYSQTSTH